VCFRVKSQGIEKGAYIRLGSTNRVADRETLNALQRLTQNITFDELPCIGAQLEDLDYKALDDAYKKMHKKPTKAGLIALGIAKDHLGKIYPTNGGMLLFARDREKWFPDSIIRCVCFQGNNQSWRVAFWSNFRVGTYGDI